MLGGLGLGMLLCVLGSRLMGSFFVCVAEVGLLGLGLDFVVGLMVGAA